MSFWYQVASVFNSLSCFELLLKTRCRIQPYLVENDIWQLCPTSKMTTLTKNRNILKWWQVLFFSLELFHIEGGCTWTWLGMIWKKFLEKTSPLTKLIQINSSSAEQRWPLNGLLFKLFPTVSSYIKDGHHDIAEILLKLNTNQSINQRRKLLLKLEISLFKIYFFFLAGIDCYLN